MFTDIIYSFKNRQNFLKIKYLLNIVEFKNNYYSKIII